MPASLEENAPRTEALLRKAGKYALVLAARIINISRDVQIICRTECLVRVASRRRIIRMVYVVLW